jgi:hypothetical protein
VAPHREGAASLRKQQGRQDFVLRAGCWQPRHEGTLRVYPRTVPPPVPPLPIPVVIGMFYLLHFRLNRIHRPFAPEQSVLRVLPHDVAKRAVRVVHCAEPRLSVPRSCVKRSRSR